MRDIQRFLKEYGFILGAASLAALASGFIRKLVWLTRWDDPAVIILLATGALSGALFILGNPEQVQAVLTKRGTRYGFNAAVMSIAFIAILGGLNYLVMEFLDQRFDVTELKKHTLSPQSKQVLAEVNREVKIIGFFTADDYTLRENFEELLNQYLAESKFLDYEVIDPDQDPIGARVYGEPYQGLLFTSGGRTARVQYSPSEQEITNALLKVTSDKQKAIYFLQGHGERDITSSAEDGYSVVAEKLRDQNYKVETLSLLISDTIPSDAAVIVIASPEGKLLDEELTRLQTYLNGGGRALIMQDPYSEAGLNIVLSNWQVRFGDGFVVDEVNRTQSSPAFPVGVNYGYSPITADLQRQRMYTFFFYARPIEQTGDSPAGITFTSLVETSENSWAETGSEISRDDTDTAGPLTMVATIESNPLFSSESATSSSKTRIVLVGDTEFVINEIVNQATGNELLFLNAINWLAEEERLIAIGPKDAGPSYIFVTDVQKNFIVFLSIFVIPLLVGATGIAVWVMRRIRSRFQV
ncbi:MAG: GldG family protein [Anaerolineae bacterium]|nr:GldG family protein [Anaerolineae bacterium]